MGVSSSGHVTILQGTPGLPNFSISSMTWFGMWAGPLQEISWPCPEETTRSDVQYFFFRFLHFCWCLSRSPSPPPTRACPSFSHSRRWLYGRSRWTVSGHVSVTSAKVRAASAALRTRSRTSSESVALTHAGLVPASESVHAVLSVEPESGFSSGTWERRSTQENLLVLKQNVDAFFDTNRIMNSFEIRKHTRSSEIVTAIHPPARFSQKHSGLTCGEETSQHYSGGPLTKANDLPVVEMRTSSSSMSSSHCRTDFKLRSQTLRWRHLEAVVFFFFFGSVTTVCLWNGSCKWMGFILTLRSLV